MRYKIERKMGPKTDYRLAISGILLTVAIVIAWPPIIASTAVNVNPLLLVSGILICLAAALVNNLRSRLQVYSCAKAAMEYAQEAMAPTAVPMGDSMQLMNTFSSGHKKGAAKWLGKAGLFMIETLGALLKAIAALVAVLYLIGTSFALPDLHFIGLWFVLATVTIIAFSTLSKFVVFTMSIAMGMLQMVQTIQGAVTGMFGGGPKVINIGGKEQKALHDFIKNNRMVIITSTALSLLTWAGFATGWWLLVGSLGQTTELGGMFLIYALATLFAIIPFVSKGLGLIELAGMGALYAIGVPPAVSLIAIVVWEASVIAVDSTADKLFKRIKSLEQFA